MYRVRTVYIAYTKNLIKSAIGYINDSIDEVCTVCVDVAMMVGRVGGCRYHGG